jgi:hypothetical protein
MYEHHQWQNPNPRQREDKLDRWVDEYIFDPLYLVYSNPSEHQRRLTPEGQRIEDNVRDLIKRTVRGKGIIL